VTALLSKANPNWPRATLEDMMKKHLATTTDEVVARLTKNWDGDVRAFDAVYDHILHMSDAPRRRHRETIPGEVRDGRQDDRLTLNSTGDRSRGRGVPPRSATGAVFGQERFSQRRSVKASAERRTLA